MMMEHPAFKPRTKPAYQEYGVVTGARQPFYSVATDSGLWQAKQAVSCLVRPMPGDKVCLCIDDTNGCYILAILEREEGGACQLCFQGDVEVRISDGAFRLASQGGVDLASAEIISLLSPSLKIHAEHGEVSVTRLSFLGAFLHAQLAKVKLVAGVLDSMVERLCQKAKRSYRDIEESEHVKAGCLDYAAGEMLSMKGKYSMLTAREDVKIDAERIHLG